MTVTAVRKDLAVAHDDAGGRVRRPRERVWRLWADPRQLERWWGPPTYPATVDTHDLRPGGRVEYHMTGPEGDRPRGFWEVDEVQPPHRLVFRDGFANEDGTPNTELPMTTVQVTIQEIGGGKTRMSIESEFPTVEAMEQCWPPWAEEGLTQAVGQIDAILAETVVEATRLNPNPVNDHRASNRLGIHRGTDMKLTTTTKVSVDGVMQGLGGRDEDRRGGSERGGWAMPLQRQRGHGVPEPRPMGAPPPSCSAVRTYEIFAGHGERGTTRATARLDGVEPKPKYAASTTPIDPMGEHDRPLR